MEIASHMEIGQDSSSKTTPPAGLRILFADDDEGMGWLVRRYLERIGHSVHVVQDGQQAVEAVKRQEFDVVLLDLLMPAMDGIEAAAKIREYAVGAGRRFPIIAATSHRVENLGDRWAEDLFDAVLSKPVQGDELARVIAAFAE